jgi:hypothetical protein
MSPMREWGQLLDELKALGVRYSIRAGLGGVGGTVILHDTAAYTPEMREAVAEAFRRAGHIERREGLWTLPERTEAEIAEWEDLMRQDEEARRERDEED